MEHEDDEPAVFHALFPGMPAEEPKEAERNLKRTSNYVVSPSYFRRLALDLKVNLS